MLFFNYDMPLSVVTSIFAFIYLSVQLQIYLFSQLTMRYFDKSGRGYDNIITSFLSLKILKPIQECNDLHNSELQQNKGLLVWIRNGIWKIKNWSDGPTREKNDF